MSSPTGHEHRPTLPTSSSDRTTGPAAPDPRRWRALAVLALAVSLIVIDGTIVNVALPTMIGDLPLTFSQAQWVTTLYSLVFAALLITTGRLGDRYGRRTLLFLGVAAFAVGSALAGLASGPTTLIAARAVQGVGGAMVLPATLSTVNATFRGRERAMAFGVWGATISGAAAIGPLLGGWLTTGVGWRWVFYVNLPLAALIAAGAAAWVPETRQDDDARGFDTGGFLTSVIGMGGLVFGLIEGRTLGWWTPLASGWARSWPLSPAALALAVGAAALAGFVAVEVRRAAVGATVLLDLRLFRLGSFTWGNTAAMVVAMGEFGLLFVLPLYLQNVRGLSPIGAGWVLAVMALGAFGSGAVAGPLARATTPATVATTGLTLEAVGVAVLAVVISPTVPVWTVAAALVVYGVGLGMASAQLTGTVLSEVPPAQSGQGSATQSTVRQLGSALGVAVIATVLAASVNGAASGRLGDVPELSQVPTEVTAGLEDSLASSAGSVLPALREGTGRAAALPAPAREAAADALAEAFTSGSRPPLWVGSAFLAVGVAATLRLPRTKVDQLR